MRHRILALACSLVLLFPGLSAAGSPPLPDEGTVRGWIEAMKASDRGPFTRIRWFCKDGAVLPPQPYACRPHGGGRQHGEWTREVERLRAHGHYIGNVLAALDVEAFRAAPHFDDALNQIAIEQFLIADDDGWILRRARYYRGAFQEETERDQARRLLLALVQETGWLGPGWVRLRVVARLLPHGPETPSVAGVRQLASDLAGRDPGFGRLRNKIHGRPSLEDARAVRAYAAPLADPHPDYARLADAIDAVYSAPPLGPALRELAARAGAAPALESFLGGAAARLDLAEGPEGRFLATAEILRDLRERVGEAPSPALRLALLDASLLLESEHYAAAATLRERLPAATRAERTRWLGAAARATYGVGLISARQLEALEAELARLEGAEVILSVYKPVLDYLALAPGWGDQRMRFHFFESVRTFARIEPHAEHFIPDQLRGSALFFYAQVLDAALRDANRLAGVRTEILGEATGGGLRALNPGLARGTLRVAVSDHPEHLDPDGIHVLPETIAELPPVAGILTAGEGNPLSHIQLLARNLGIPNVAVDERYLPRLREQEGRRVVLAASPGGSVKIALDDGRFDGLFATEQLDHDTLIRPDLDKLDLARTDLVTLSALRADDSGRIVGPKAAKLGELRHHYPEAVAEGLALPFGIFREVLARPHRQGLTLGQWMVSEYRRIEALPARSPAREAETEAFRRALHERLEAERLDEPSLARLAAALERAFGPDGTYGVFVRSDTNVEDLPGFTGAGLNLTVPNVVGLAGILEAIPRVWASPFTARAFAWRQAHMDAPEHVYPAVLLMRTVPVDKSGVLVTRDVETGDPDWFSVAVNEGVGGAVDGQAAESLRIHTESGRVRLLAQATAPDRRVVDPAGGLRRLPASAADRVLTPAEIDRLRAFVRDLPRRFPPVLDDSGHTVPADVEFGFLAGELMLFQIRPFLDSDRARRSDYLRSLDADLRDLHSVRVRLDEVPPGVTP